MPDHLLRGARRVGVAGGVVCEHEGLLTDQVVQLGWCQRFVGCHEGSDGHVKLPAVWTRWELAGCPWWASATTRIQVGLCFR